MKNMFAIFTVLLWAMPEVRGEQLAAITATNKLIRFNSATPGTIAHSIVGTLPLPHTFVIEHPSGRLDVRLEQPVDGGAPVAMLLRTARRLFEGSVFAQVPVAGSERIDTAA